MAPSLVLLLGSLGSNWGFTGLHQVLLVFRKLEEPLTVGYGKSHRVRERNVNSMQPFRAKGRPYRDVIGLFWNGLAF